MQTIWMVTATDTYAGLPAERAFTTFALAADTERRWLRLGYADVRVFPMVVHDK